MVKTSVRLKIRTQLMIVLVAMSIIPMITMGVFTYINTIKNMENEKKNTLKAYSERVLNSVDVQVRSIENQLRGLSNNADLIATIKEFNEFSASFNTIRYYSIIMTLQNLVNNSDRTLETVFIADMKGKVVVDGSKWNDKYISSSFYDMKDFEAVKKSNDFIIGKPFESRATNKLVLPVSRQVKSAEGFLGTVTAVINLEEFTKEFDSYNFAKTGEIIIVGHENTVLYDSLKDNIGGESENEALRTVASEQEKQEDFVTYKYGDIKSVMHYGRSDLTGWLVCAQVGYDEFMRPITEFIMFLGLGMIVLFTASFIISIVYSGYISTPLNSLIGLMRRVSDGDLSVSAVFKSGIVEIEELKLGFSDMVESLKKLINGVLKATGSINETTLVVNAAAQSSLAHSENSMSAVSEINDSIQKQANSTEAAERKIGMLAEAIASAKEYSEQVRIFSGKVNESSENGLKMMDVLKSKSEESARSTQTMDEVIKLLNDEMIEINKIARTITNIAKQTKLLSLNASIEAARAGDAGKSFSVVAGEIKNLSEQTSSEAGEIDSIISGIRLKSEELVSAMKKASTSAEEQNWAVSGTEEIFSEIFRSIIEVGEKMSNTVNRLDAINEDKNGIVEMVKDINSLSGEVACCSEDIRSSTDSQMEMLRELHRYSDDLNGLSEELDRSVKAFRL